MPSEYYKYLKKTFFSTNSADKIVEGIEYLISNKDFLDTHNCYPIAYALHNKFISQFFTLYSYLNNSMLLSRFVDAYSSLLCFFEKLTFEDKNDPEFKSIVVNILNCIINVDKEQQFALALSSKIVKLNLPAEFCLTVVTRINLNGGAESKQKFMEILDHLYNNSDIWNNTDTPRCTFSLVASTPPNIASLLYHGALSHCSEYVNQANLSFLFYMQSCCFITGNTDGCNFVDHCLPTAVASLILYEEKCLEWRWVLKSLAQYPDGSMEQAWRSKVVKELNTQYFNNSTLLNALEVNKKSNNWMPNFNVFICCMEEDYEAPKRNTYSLMQHT